MGILIILLSLAYTFIGISMADLINNYGSIKGYAEGDPLSFWETVVAVSFWPFIMVFHGAFFSVFFLYGFVRDKHLFRVWKRRAKRSIKRDKVLGLDPEKESRGKYGWIEYKNVKK